MLLLDEMELTQEKLKGTPKPKQKKFYFRENVVYKQAVVKFLSSLNFKNIDYAAFYIAKHSENFMVKDENGNEVKVQDVLREWKKNMSKDEKSNEAMHLSFSIDEIKIKENLEALEKAVEEVARHNFYEHRYMYIIHKHQGKPHIHIIINKRSKFTNKKMHFKDKKEIKNFYEKLRNEFAENLNHYNKDFNYTSNFKVERDLKHQLLKKTIKDLEKKLNLNTRIIQEAKENINAYEKELENINQRIKINLDETINITSNEKPRENLQKINTILKRNKNLNRVKKDIERNIQKQKTLIHNTEFIIKEATTKDFVTVEHTIKFFESQMNKRNMTLRQYFNVNDLKKDFQELKHFYDVKVSQELKTEKDEIQLLSMTTNAYTIYKLYKQAIRREFENSTVLKNSESKQMIEENKKILQKIFKQRDHEVELMQRKTERTLELLKDENSPTKQKKENELKFLKKERKFIEQLKEYNHDLCQNFFDKLNDIRKFHTNVKNITEKTSIFKVQNIVAELEYFKGTTKNKNEIDHLKDIEKELKVYIDDRAFKNYRTVQFLKEQLKTSKTIKEKTDTINNLEFLKKEKELIIKMYDKYVSENDKKDFVTNLEKSIKLLDDTKSIFSIKKLEEERKFRIKFNIHNQEELTILKEIKKDIRLKVMLREDKVKRGIEYLVDKLNSKELNKVTDINKAQESLTYLKDEHKTIKEFKQSYQSTRNRNLEIER